jgi:hypothetical protein
MTMADGDLCDIDILAWSEQQARVLRSLAARRDLPNGLDLSHVVEEIEDVGLSELHAAASFIRLIMTHAIKCGADPVAPSLLHWHAEIGNRQTELASRLTASMRNRIDLDQARPLSRAIAAVSIGQSLRPLVLYQPVEGLTLWPADDGLVSY